MPTFYQQYKNIILVSIIIITLIGNIIITSKTWLKNKFFLFNRTVIESLPQDITGLLGVGISIEDIMTEIPKGFNANILKNPYFLNLLPLPTLEEIRPAQIIIENEDDLLARFSEVKITNSGIGDSLIISWKPPEQISLKNINLYRSTEYKTLGEKISDLAPDARTYKDTAVKADQIYFYTLRGVSEIGTESSKIYQYPGLAKDITPPPSPSNVKLIKAEPKQIKIAWDNPTVEDFAYARIYRSTLSGQTGKLIADEIRNNEYTDTDILSGVEYFYTITSVDLSLNESPRKTSDTLAKIIFDKIAILGQGDILLLLKGIEVENPGNGTIISIKWQNPTDEKFDHVRIYRSTKFKELGELLTDAEKKDEGYIDTSVTKEKVYYYTLRTIDTLGRESDNTIQYIGVPRDLLGPDPPTNISVRQENQGKALISWIPPKDSDLSYLRVYRSLNAGDTGHIIADKITSTFYEDAIEDNIIYYYSVTAVDTSGNESKKPIPTSLRGGRIPFLPSDITPPAAQQ